MQQQTLDLETPALPVARAMGEIGQARAQEHAERVDPGFTARARRFVLEYLEGRESASSEDMTDACKAAGIVPPKDQAFGRVYSLLAEAKQIEFVGFCPRRKGHGTAGGRLWRRARCGA